MTTQLPAPIRQGVDDGKYLFLRIPNKNEIHVKDTRTGEILLHIPQSDWQDLAFFFIDISDPSALL